MSNTVAIKTTLSGAGEVAAGLKGIKAESHGLGSGLMSLGSNAEKGLGKLGGAVGHAKSQITGLMSGVGLLAGGAGLLGLSSALTSSVTKANDFGLSVYTLGKLTGTAAEPMSALIAVMEKYGVEQEIVSKSLGMLEKNVGNFTKTTKTAAKFNAEFGFSLVDAKGKVKDANTLVLQAADYFNNKLVPASQKALLESKLFGKGWQAMLPVLALGSKGIREAEQSAKDLGLTLNQQNVNELAAYRKSTRDLGEAWGGLQLQIGLAVIPALNDLAQSMTKFVTDNKGNIISALKQGVQFAKDFGGAIEHQVIPMIQGIVGAWNSLPGPLKDILVKGFVAGKVTKFLFDVGPLDIAKAGAGLLAGMVKGVLGIKAAVVNVQGAVVNGVGGLGGAAGAAEGAAGVGIVGLLTSAAVVATFAGGIYLGIKSLMGFADQNNAGAAAGLTPEQVAAQRYQNSSSADQEVFRKHNYGNVPTGNPGSPGSPDDRNRTGLIAALDKTASHADNLTGSLDDLRKGTAALAAEDKRQADHAKAKAAIGDNHAFLNAFRSGDAKVAIKDFDKELAYMATASAEQKKSPIYHKGLVESIAALKKAEVGATDAQKKVLSVDIGKMQTLLSMIDTDVRKIHNVGATSGEANQQANDLGHVTPKPGGKGVSVLDSTNKRGNARGIIGKTTAPTTIGEDGVMGEAGGELFGIFRNPRQMRGGSGGDLNVHVHLDGGVYTPGAARALGEQLGPTIASWLQRNGLMARSGSPMRG